MKIKIEVPMNTEFSRRLVQAVELSELDSWNTSKTFDRIGILVRNLKDALPGFDIGRGGHHVWIKQQGDDARIAIVEAA